MRPYALMLVLFVLLSIDAQGGILSSYTEDTPTGTRFTLTWSQGCPAFGGVAPHQCASGVTGLVSDNPLYCAPSSAGLTPLIDNVSMCGCPPNHNPNAIDNTCEACTDRCSSPVYHTCTTAQTCVLTVPSNLCDGRYTCVDPPQLQFVWRALTTPTSNRDDIIGAVQDINQPNLFRVVGMYGHDERISRYGSNKIGRGFIRDDGNTHTSGVISYYDWAEFQMYFITPSWEIGSQATARDIVAR